MGNNNALISTAHYNGFIEMEHFCVCVCCVRCARVDARSLERLIHCFDIFIHVIILFLLFSNILSIAAAWSALASKLDFHLQTHIIQRKRERKKKGEKI